MFISEIHHPAYENRIGIMFKQKVHIRARNRSNRDNIHFFEGIMFKQKSHDPGYSKTAAHRVALRLTKYIVTWMLTLWAASFCYSILNIIPIICTFQPRSRTNTTCVQNIKRRNIAKRFAVWYNKSELFHQPSFHNSQSCC